MRRVVSSVLTLAAVVLLAVLSVAVASGDRGPKRDRGPKFVDKLAPLLPCGEFLGGQEGTGMQVNTNTYEFRAPSNLTGTPPGLAPGNAVDLHWVHDFNGSQDPNVGSPLVWDFGAQGVKNVLAYPSIDHGPVPQEALEFTVYSSASRTGPWVPAKLKMVFEPGWNPEWIADDFVSLWKLQQRHRYVALKWGGPGALIRDGDAEVDSVCSADDDDDDDDGEGED